MCDIDKHVRKRNRDPHAAGQQAHCGPRSALRARNDCPILRACVVCPHAAAETADMNAIDGSLPYFARSLPHRCQTIGRVLCRQHAKHIFTFPYRPFYDYLRDMRDVLQARYILIFHTAPSSIMELPYETRKKNKIHTI